MTSRAYFYHLRFELYNQPPPTFGDITNENPKSPVQLETISNSLSQHSQQIEQVELASETVDKAGHEHNLERRSSIIDCGLQRADTHKQLPLHNDKATAAAPQNRSIEVAAKDWRFGRVLALSIQLGPLGQRSDAAMDAAGANSSAKSHAMRARIESLRVQGREEELGWGIVHLYREGEETVGLGDALGEGAVGAGSGSGSGSGLEELEGMDTTVLCIPAVPSYMTASDFLGWVGEKTRELVSHFRMVMTGRMNRYMMLMKFRDGGEARKWRREWDGKVFNGMEVCD